MAGRIDGASILGSPKTANYALFSVKHWKACEVRVQVLREMYGVMIEEPPPNFPHKLCPNCHSELVVRIAKKGLNTGQLFYGGTAFPKNRYTSDC